MGDEKNYLPSYPNSGRLRQRLRDRTPPNLGCLKTSREVSNVVEGFASTRWLRRHPPADNMSCMEFQGSETIPGAPLQGRSPDA